MRDPLHRRLHAELFLAAFGADTMGAVDRSVTDRFTSLLEEEPARAGERVFSAGDSPDYYYFLREGRVQLVCDGRTPWTYEGRSVFGTSDALLERPRQRTAIAQTDIQAMRVNAEAWHELLEDSFALARAAIAGLVRAVAALEQRLWMAGGVSELRPIAPPFGGATLDTVEKLAVLTDARLLRGAGVQTLSDLAAASEVVTFGRNDTLIVRGERGGRIHLLLDGHVEATREAPEVRWRGCAGDVVCGVAAFGDPILAWEAHARAPGRALTIRVADWMDLMEEHFDMVRTTLGALSVSRDDLLERLQ